MHPSCPVKPLRDHFGNWRAVGVNFRAIEAYTTKRREAEKSNATITRETPGLSC